MQRLLPHQGPKTSAIDGRVAALGKVLKSILAPTTDRLLPGYSEIIETVKNQTVAEQERLNEK